MQAIRAHEFGPPSVMRYEAVPDPAPGPGQILIEVKAAGVNPVDTYVRAGSYAKLPTLPYIPGSDAAGVVRQVGPEVRGIRPGDRVYTTGSAGDFLTGASAQLVVCNPSQVHPLPAQVSFAQGAAVGVPCATAYRALLQKGRAVGGETVLVHGASGAVGTAAVQLAVAAGLTVVGTAGTERGRELVRAQGAHHVLDHTAPDHLDKALALTEGRGMDLVLENLANVNLGQDLNLLAKHGRVVVIGCRGTVEINPRAAMMRDATILGLALWNAGERELAGIYAALTAGLANGTLRPVVGQEFSLQDAARAHERVLQAGAYGKIVLLP